jgi:hypothetical protein
MQYCSLVINLPLAEVQRFLKVSSHSVSFDFGFSGLDAGSVGSVTEAAFWSAGSFATAVSVGG